MRHGSIVTGALSILLAAGMAAAQSTGGAGGATGAPAGGSSTGAPSGPGAAGMPTDLDLPMEKPAYTGEPVPEEPPEEPDIEDPSDEPPPTIYGEEIDSENDTIFYVLDISGSMGWDSQSYTTVDGTSARGPRIDRAKAELTRSIMALSASLALVTLTVPLAGCNVDS